MPITACRICKSDLLTSYKFQEKMFGTQEEFDYVQCRDCGCLQISEIPDDMTKHYPPADYYSLEAQNYKSPFRSLSRRLRASYAVYRRGLLGHLLFTIKKPAAELCVYGEVRVTKNSRILDVGGGTGQHVFALRCLGLEHSLAIDKFIDGDIDLGGKPLAKKATVQETEGPFDIITFHHSFEHMENPVRTLIAAGSKLADSGQIVLRLPCVSSFAWNHYRENWVNLDVPRHFFLHSKNSIREAAKQAGLKVIKLWCDSTSFQFWGSEQYLRSIPLGADNSYAEGLQASVFSATEIKEFERRAEQLNSENLGDWICVVLEK